jgi:hypothetical protein
MRDGQASLAALVSAEHDDWDDPVVCRGVFGTVDPHAIAAWIARVVEETLGAAIARARFYRVSVGCVTGLDLDDGRAVVIKAQRSARPERYFRGCQAVRLELANRGFPCPRPIGEAVRRGETWVTFEELALRGERADAHDPLVRDALASSLAEMVRITRPLAAASPLGGAWFTGVADDRIWPRPHSPLFDFEATAAGAEWIDAIAARARARRLSPAGDRVIGHFDWRVEHARFDGSKRIVASYDWDSLHAELEPILVGANAHAFTADWQREDIVRVPAASEIEGFFSDYERARGAPFSAAERALARASCVYSLAYTARCNHALGPREEGANGDFRPLLRAVAEDMLAG